MTPKEASKIKSGDVVSVGLNSYTIKEIRQIPIMDSEGNTAPDLCIALVDGDTWINLEKAHLLQKNETITQDELLDFMGVEKVSFSNDKNISTKDYESWALTKDRTKNQYNELALRLTRFPDQLKLLHASFGISGESGEIVDIIKKHILYNKELDKENVKEEIGDLLWYVNLLIQTIGSSFEEIMQINHDKLEKRYPTGFSEKLAQERKDKL